MRYVPASGITTGWGAWGSSGAMTRVSREVTTIVMLDATAVELPLTLRRVRQGDRFTPLGMRGSKLVSDYLTDRKRNLIEKRRQLVVTDVRDRVVPTGRTGHHRSRANHRRRG